MKSLVAAIIIWISYYFFAFSNAQNIRPTIVSNQIEHHECEICRIEECRTPSTLECLSGNKFSSQSFLSISSLKIIFINVKILILSYKINIFAFTKIVLSDDASRFFFQSEFILYILKV